MLIRAPAVDGLLRYSGLVKRLPWSLFQMVVSRSPGPDLIAIDTM